MIKLLFAILLLVWGSISLRASQEIPMQIINQSASNTGNTYAPARPWYITQDDYALTLPALGDDYMFELRDENDEVVYTTYLPAGTTSVVLPPTLSGDFEIRLVGDTYYYRGYISL